MSENHANDQAYRVLKVVDGDTIKINVYRYRWLGCSREETERFSMSGKSYTCNLKKTELWGEDYNGTIGVIHATGDGGGIDGKYRSYQNT